MKNNLYSWQEECLRRWMAGGGRGIVEAVTGAGKTRLALEAIGALEKKYGAKLLVKIVVPTAALMRQWSKALREFLSEAGGGLSESVAGAGASGNESGGAAAIGPGDSRSESAAAMGPGDDESEGVADIGLCGGGRKASAEHKYMIYVVNSARYTLARQILANLRQGRPVFLIADECHHYASGENRLIFEFMDHMKDGSAPYHCLGLSATLPAGEARRTLVRALGPCVYSYNLKKALAARTIAKYDIYHISLNLLPKERERYNEISAYMQQLFSKLLKARPQLRGKSSRELYEALGQLAGNGPPQISKAATIYLKLSYQRKSLVCLAKERSLCALCLIRLLGLKEKIIVFGERIRQAEELYQHLSADFPGRVGRYHSQMGAQANKNVLERFRNGEIRILITCKSLDEGMDIPDVSVGIILSGTSGQRQRIQRLGRVIRKAEGKDFASLYYLHTDQTSEDECFLPQGGQHRITELYFDSGHGEFYNPVYEEAACRAFDGWCMGEENAGMNEKVRQEILRCLRLGSVRCDWELPLKELEEKAAAARGVRERNYWICMAKVHAAREE